MEKSGGNKPNGNKAGRVRSSSTGEAGACLTEFEVAYMSSKTIAHTFERKMARVQYCDKTQSVRELIKVWIAVKRGQKQMWADSVTGSLFYPDGRCRGAAKVKIVEWL